MDDDSSLGGQLRRSWDVNASAWIRTIREKQIESRKLATDAAILQALRAYQPRRVLDVGCGEGWLARALVADGIEVVGVDASEPLIRAAKEQGGGRFHVLNYADIVAAPMQLGRGFDVAVCNFSLLEENISPLLGAMRSIVASGGSLLVQTVHPWSGNGDNPYHPGWREEDFRGFGADFGEVMPWYFRTMASWVEVLGGAGWRMVRLQEPLHPASGAPLSLIMACQ